MNEGYTNPLTNYIIPMVDHPLIERDNGLGPNFNWSMFLVAVQIFSLTYTPSKFGNLRPLSNFCIVLIIHPLIKQYRYLKEGKA
jgi:hypothetical protein